jgi:hypothetical protein
MYSRLYQALEDAPAQNRVGSGWMEKTSCDSRRGKRQLSSQLNISIYSSSARVRTLGELLRATPEDQEKVGKG